MGCGIACVVVGLVVAVVVGALAFYAGSVYRRKTAEAKIGSAEEEAKLAVFPPVLRSGQSSEGQGDLMSSDGYLMKSRKWSCVMDLMVETRICRRLRERES